MVGLHIRTVHFPSPFGRGGRGEGKVEQRTENEPRVLRFSEVRPAGQMGDSPPFARLVSVEANIHGGNAVNVKRRQARPELKSLCEAVQATCSKWPGSSVGRAED